MDPDNGEMRSALVGGRNSRRLDRATQARRQKGSAQLLVE
jgi:membrane carboxypeptidase/penicillin-binding protein